MPDSFADMHNEAWMVVERWDDQIGGWMEVDEATNADVAREMIGDFKARDIAEFGQANKYSIKYHQRTVI